MTNKKIIAIPSKNLWESWYNMYISIYKTLKTNWYTCYFLEPNELVKEYLLKAWVNLEDILEVGKKINHIKNYKNKNKAEYRQLTTFIRAFFWNIAYKYILNESLKEYHEYDYLIKKYKIKIIIVYNGIFRIWRLAWIDNDCKIVYFENWYFPNSLQIDNKWINSESSIAKLSYNELLNFKKVDNNKIKDIRIFNKKIEFSFFKKLILNLKSYNYKTSIFYILFILKKSIEILKRKIFFNNEEEVILKKGWKYIFIAFQVNDDTQLIFNSPIIRNMQEIIEFYYDDIKDLFPDYKLVVKEHPMDIWRINYKKLQKRYPDIIWIKKWNIDDIIGKSEYTICVNSSVGFQALAKYKKVFTLWENFYSNNPWIEKLKNKESFKKQLSRLKEKEINKKEVDNYINIFKNELFINWSWKWWGRENYNKKTLKEICEYIVN